MAEVEEERKERKWNGKASERKTKMEVRFKRRVRNGRGKKRKGKRRRN